MAITKVNKGSDRILLLMNADGTIRQVVASIRTVVSENGADTNLSVIQDVDLWSQLTAQQQTNLQAIATRLVGLTSTSDVPLPVMPVPVAIAKP